MYRAAAGHYALWFLIVLVFGKMIATSLTIGIGGSGGVFGPSLFVGATTGMAFGEIAVHIFGAAAGQPALYAVIGMGAVLASAAQSPLTAMASVVEMTGDFTLTLPVMLAVAIATTVSRALSHGTIYTTKLIRRGTDIDRPAARHAFDTMTVADAVHPFPAPVDLRRTNNTDDAVPDESDLTRQLGPITRTREPQALFANDSLAQALRQLVLYGRDGLPVLATDGGHLKGWITNQNVLRAVAQQLAAAAPDVAAGQRAAAWADPHAGQADHDRGTQLNGYRIIEHTLTADAPAVGHHLSDIAWPAGYLPVSVLHHRQLVEPDPQLRLAAGDRISILTTSGTNVATELTPRPHP